MIGEYLSANLFEPLYNSLRGYGDINKATSEWLETFALNPREQATLATQRLSDVLECAYRETVYYRDLFDAAGVSARLDDPAVLNDIPLLDKPLIRAQPESFISRTLPAQKIIKTMTGGSTSDPLVFYRDHETYCSRWGLQAAANLRLGWRPGEWYALLWGAPQDLWDMRSAKQRFKNTLAIRRISLDASGATEESVREFIRQLWKKRPRIIYGYPVLLEFLIHFCRQLDLQFPPIELVVVTAEKLTDHAYNTISKTFGCPILDRYASREFGVVADQRNAEEEAYVVPASVKIEVLPFADDDPSYGELIITDLLNRAMPFVRYRTGDVGRLKTAYTQDGPVETLTEVTGRTTDLIIAPSGKIISGTAALPLFREFPGIDQAQIRQLDFERFKILVVKNADFTSATAEGMRRKMDSYCGEEVDVEFEFVDHIPRDPSGKFRVVISELAEEYLRSRRQNIHETN